MPKLKRTVHRPWLPKYEPQAGRVHTNTKFYQSTAWRKLRAVKLEQQPLCELCQTKEILRPAEMVDHILPINQGGEPLAMENLQSLCHSCHNQKSARERHQNDRFKRP